MASTSSSQSKMASTPTEPSASSSEIRSSSSTFSISITSVSSSLSDPIIRLTTTRKTSTSLIISPSSPTSATPLTTSKKPVTTPASNTATSPVGPEPGPSTSSTPLTPIPSDPEVTIESVQKAKFKLILDAGECANLGVPKVNDIGTGVPTSNLESLGGNRYTSSLMLNRDGTGRAYTFLADGGERCGDSGACLYVLMTYDSETMVIQILRISGKMYPLSIWADGGKLPNGAPADSQTNKYNCWGWSESDYPFSYLVDDDTVYAVSTSIPDATIYITFCPADGPAASSIESTTFFAPMNIGGEETRIVIGTETVAPASTFLAPLRPTAEPSKSNWFELITPQDMIPVPTTLTNSLGMPTATSTISASVIPTLSTLTDDRGLAVSTISVNLTTPASPIPTSPPESTLTTTFWTTSMTVNGSVVPAIGGQVGVLTLVSKTFILESNSAVPVEEFSSRSTRSTHTNLPSDTASASITTTSSSRSGMVAGAVVGSLLGVSLLILLLWALYVKYRRRQQRTLDYDACQSPMWGSRSVAGLNSRGASVLDLEEEIQPRASFVEPWVEEQQPPLASRKMQREMELRGEGLMVAGPSRAASATSSSSGHAYTALRPSKSVNRVPPEQPSEPLTLLPARNNTLSSIHPSQESGHPLPPAISTQLLVQPSSAAPVPVRHQPPPQPPSVYPRYSDERARDTAIPPQYNEAWNIGQSLPSE